MSQYLIKSCQISANEINLQELEPEFRKATLNMVLATFAMKTVLREAQDVPRHQIATIVGTHFGEVESSLDFLSTYRQSKITRPILFQNSLHNSTLGFASIQLGLTGPGMTISTDDLTVRAVANCAESLLTTSEYVLICFVDYIPSALVESYQRKHPFLQQHLNLARAFLLTRKDVRQYQTKISGKLQDFAFTENT